MENARGRLLFFVDADVALTNGTFARGRIAIEEPGVDAVIGSYDDDPAVHTVVSQFKNLAHHYFHQQSVSEATTFWGACGLIRRELFLAAGGFDEGHRGLEDVALGYRLTARGARIRLDPGLRVKHLKRWTLLSLLVTDLTQRAIPWAALWLENGYLPKGLNFDCRQRLAAILAAAISALALTAIFRPQALILLAFFLAAAVWINRGLYLLLFQRGGVRLTAGGFLLQQFYYLYSLVGLATGVILHYARRFKFYICQRTASPSRP